jgi:hypothetical protein
MGNLPMFAVLRTRWHGRLAHALRYPAMLSGTPDKKQKRSDL